MTDNEAMKKIVDKMIGILKVGFTHGTYARNSEGEPCSVIDDDAICFCMYGAETRALYLLKDELPTETKSGDMSLKFYFSNKLTGFFDTKYGLGVASFNDSRTQAEVISALTIFKETLND